MCHPHYNDCVLVIEDGQFAWVALATLRSKKKWAVDKQRKVEGYHDHPKTSSNFSTTISSNSETIQGE
jgi:hypothetical protein